ncbi:MAG: SDR family NAD(P)-dependent oxidoreductase [Deltaproteobacteria bacterium]|nr:SDR family NAD(P)-dependent oxidoreductase [Deltaproteobacteria bacterium]
MANLLKDRVVIVTGAGNGIGRAHALACAREGARVVVNDLGGARDGTGADTSAAARVVAEIEALGGQALANTDSVTDPAGCQRMVDAAMGRWGRVDVLVNNAGILRDKTFMKLTDAEWDIVNEVHVKGAYHMCRAAIPALSKQGGAIINTTSYSGMIGNFGQSNYGAAKAAIYGLTRVLSMELRKANITVNAIAPIAKTRMTTDIAMVEEEWTPEQISPPVVFLASELGRAVTGAVLGIQGQRIHLYEVKVNEGVEKKSKDLWTPEEIAAAWPQISAWESKPAVATEAKIGPDPVKEAFSYVPLAFVAEKAGDWKARIHFAIKDGSSQTLCVGEGRAWIEDGLAGSPDCTIKTDTETIVGIFNKTVDAQKAFMKGKITADNMGVLMKFAMYFDFSRRPPAKGEAPAATPVVESKPKAWPIGKTWDDGAKFADPKFAAMYAECTGDDSPAYAGADPIVPPMFHVRLFHGMMFKIATDPELELDLLRLVHGEHDATFHRPIRPWDLVQVRGQLESVEEKSSGILVASRLFGFVDGQLALEARTAYFIRGAKKADGPKAPPAPEPERAAPDYERAIAVAPDLSIRYAVPSLDDNPIHIDRSTAISAGHKDIILQGLCTMAMTGAAAVKAVGDNDARRLRRLSVRFARPVHNGVTLTTRGWKQGDGSYLVETRDADGNLVISNGRVELR